MAEENSKVGLVLVSHSSAIAEGLSELVEQVAGPDVPIVSAGGAADGSLGTNGERVLSAIRSLAARGSAIVLVDLGSSVLAVRAALPELTPDERGRVFVADAPFVEGAVAAGVAASTGAAPSEIVRVAEEARSAGKF